MDHSEFPWFKCGIFTQTLSNPKCHLHPQNTPLKLGVPGFTVVQKHWSSRGSSKIYMILTWDCPQTTVQSVGKDDAWLILFRGGPYIKIMWIHEVQLWSIFCPKTGVCSSKPAMDWLHPLLPLWFLAPVNSSSLPPSLWLFLLLLCWLLKESICNKRGVWICKINWNKSEVHINHPLVEQYFTSLSNQKARFPSKVIRVSVYIMETPWKQIIKKNTRMWYKSVVVFFLSGMTPWAGVFKSVILSSVPKLNLLHHIGTPLGTTEMSSNHET